ncbi:hypothetical protein MFLAVUS_007855 [Mucor flavus]|uniref:Uncharacterized protein n=1 Tax=Mucor flavus TaxID=439312 RepID=A0ABP9Z5H2_9FUNG
MTRKKQEDDDVPLVQYLLDDKRQKRHQQQAYFNRLPPPIILNNPKGLIRRPSCPTTPLSLLDTFSDDEDDQDLIPIGFISSKKQGQFQSAAEKYKEKVKAQLDSMNILDDEDDDNLPLSKSCYFI